MLGRSDAPWSAALRQTISDGLARIDVPQESGDEDERWWAKHCVIRTTDERVVPFRLRGAQRELHEQLTGRDIVDKARKLGISTYIAARFYKAVTTQRNVAAAMVAHKPDSAQELWRIVKLMKDRDPRRLRTKYDSRRELYYPELNSHFIVLQGGRGSGRGGTFTRLHISELAHFNSDALDTISGMVAAVPPPESGSEIIIESTANGEGNEFHRRWIAMTEGRSEYAGHFFPWHEHPEYVRPWRDGWADLDAEELALQATLGLTREQLAFRRSMIEEIGPDLFRQEYPSDWQESFLASGRKYFDGMQLQKLERAHGLEPIRHEDFGSGSYLKIWEPPKRGRRYCAGADTSEGDLGGDAQDVRILDVETMAEVAALHGRWPIHVFARKLAELVTPYSAFTAVERNNHGHAVIEHLVRGDDRTRMPSSLLYRHKGYDQSGAVKRKYGWPTDVKTKPIALAGLEESIRRGHLLARDPTFYREARAYAHLENGKAGAPPGMHDDSVMAMALAIQARKHARVTVGYSSDAIPLGI